MRLTKIKLAGFKSFVDPTPINFPSNLTGVVGPNGCGKSNVIDAVRWVMGELSAKHLRGDNMADVVFNGSSARKPVGTASVELVFDNADGKIGGAYAGYSEISLKRQVSRDGTSVYFINGGRCRRKDITKLFLGTGLGSRSYAIIEQGMISRVIDAKAEDMRAFVEEAAGISRYKERRKETEARIADTRENLERLQDVRDEVEKQIRHLQRQAASARRYQALKEQERRLSAELLALRLRELDSGAEVHDATVRARELAMQAELGAQRAAEAAIEKQRAVHTTHSETLAAVQARYYEVGADISRARAGDRAHARAARAPARRSRPDRGRRSPSSRATSRATRRSSPRSPPSSASSRPQLASAEQAERHAAQALEAAERSLQDWQQRWEAHTQQVSGAEQTSEVERARIEQLENQLRRLAAQQQRLAAEEAALGAQHTEGELEQLTRAEAAARSRREELARSLAASQEHLQQLRAAQLAAEGELEGARAAREGAREELTSLEALQAAALSDHAGDTTEWLSGAGLAARPRLAAALEVEPGWERAVETVLGDYLEAVCVEVLDEAAGALGALKSGRLTLIEGERPRRRRRPARSAERVEGPAAILARLAGVLTAARSARGARRASAARGRGFLHHAAPASGSGGLAAREPRRRGARGRARARAAPEGAARRGRGGRRRRRRRPKARSRGAREELRAAEAARDELQQALQGDAPHARGAARGARGAARPRDGIASERGARLRADAGELAREHAGTQDSLARSREALAGALRRARGPGGTPRRTQQRARGAARCLGPRAQPRAGDAAERARAAGAGRVAPLDAELGRGGHGPHGRAARPARRERRARARARARLGR